MNQSTEQDATDADLLDLLADIARRFALGPVQDNAHVLRMLRRRARDRETLLARVDEVFGSLAKARADLAAAKDELARVHTAWEASSRLAAARRP